MIDFKQLLEETPRSSAYGDVKKLVDDAEAQLKKQILNSPDRNYWMTDSKLNLSNSAAREVFDTLVSQFVDQGLTQLSVSFIPEISVGRDWTPPIIRFEIHRPPDASQK